MKSFYYLHVPKASGRVFFKHVLKGLVESNELNNRYLFPESNDISYTHHGWHDLISNDTYLISSLRDPVEAMISYRIHHGGLDSKDHLMSTIDKVANLQSKSFMTWADNRVEPESKIELDRELILDRLKKVNLLLDSKDININNFNKLKERIAKDLGSIEKYSEEVNEDTDEFRTAGVKEFCDSLTKEEIDIIKEVNYMDVELYEAARSLFYPI